MPSRVPLVYPHNASEHPAAHSAVARARAYSLYLDRLLQAAPTLFDGIDLESPCTLTAPELAPDASRDEVWRELRSLRARTLATLIVRDIAGWAPLGEVTGTMSRLAELTVQSALNYAMREVSAIAGEPRNDRGEAQSLMVIGMGKLGGGELNVSSDIDLVFVYPESGETSGPRVLSNEEYFTRVGRLLIGALSEVTQDGFVFRVDMRLRPYGDSGPLAVNLDMLENYLVTQGREWERCAWIKARVLTGGPQQALMQTVQPFIYRRHLDFSALASMRELHRQIRAEVARRDRAANIKLGRGGIREIEFLAQVFQLMRGGHDAALRQSATLTVLGELAGRGLLPNEAVTELTRAYEFLRVLEHRLQYRDDQQTHDIPGDVSARFALAQSLGYEHFDALQAALDTHRAMVERHFDALFADTPHDTSAQDPAWSAALDSQAAMDRLQELGFSAVDELQARLTQMYSSGRYRQMPASSQARLDRLVPLALTAAAAGTKRDETALRLLTFLEAISRRESYLALLEEFPQSREQLTTLMRASPWVAEYLTRHPILLDEMLDARNLRTPPDWPALATQLRAALDATGGDTERDMDILRHFKHAQTLRLVAQDLAGALPLETLSDHLSDLACIVLREAMRLAWQGMRQRTLETPVFAAIGYGKLGGKELGYASDLDLVFLYRDEHDRGGDSMETYVPLAQRINTWLTGITPAGQLYDTDFRLRPDGDSGLITSSFEAYARYQHERAWLWEHQALTRARFVAGDAAIGRDFEALRVDILRQPRDLAKLPAEVLAMREKMHQAHPNSSGLFDVKHDPGGIIDVEFLVQTLILGHAHRHAALTANIGNLALLKLAATLGLIPTREALAAHDAYRFWRQSQHTLRLGGARFARIAPDEAACHAAAVRRLWERVMGAAIALK